VAFVFSLITFVNMQLEFSFIIPVYNRPNEIEELLESFDNLKTNSKYEIVIIEDGSTISSRDVVKKYDDRLQISYYFKDNSGPGDSRNYGMRQAKGNYFIILDSDCLLPPNYLDNAIKSLKDDYVDCYGGPDAAHLSFTNLQKAINFSMTSFITTGGIRGHKKSVDEFQPRSFNMGLSKKAFEATKGFGNIHPGEDPDLSIRLKKISWSKFYKQVNKFGMTRPILNKWYPETKKITYWFPTVFAIGLILSILLWVAGYNWPIFAYGMYFAIAFVLALLTTNISVAFLAIPAILIQFFGYGWGFLKSTVLLAFSNQKPEKIFPHLFFKVS